ncbi:MAG: cyclase family protein [Alphaproteobacteria bacterium]|nr:cyclase family protein [Alphaproteobacteria bacterium]
MSRLIDISPLVHPGVAVYPGDTPFSRRVLLSIAGGDNIDLSTITTTVHVGAHTDAPSHYIADGAGIDARPLERYYGRAQVISVDLPRGARVRPEHLPGPIQAPRVLFHTGSFPDPDHFNPDFVSLSPELIEVLADQGAVLVGIDTPSVDPADDKVLPSHAALARRDMAVLEGVVLDHVDDGLYTLIALPLRLAGADASPVRAVLVAT